MSVLFFTPHDCICNPREAIPKLSTLHCVNKNRVQIKYIGYTLLKIILSKGESNFLIMQPEEIQIAETLLIFNGTEIQMTAPQQPNTPIAYT